jgi:hypothetical protein
MPSGVISPVVTRAQNPQKGEYDQLQIPFHPGHAPATTAVELKSICKLLSAQWSATFHPGFSG